MGFAGVKHRPYLRISGTQATVVVGLGAVPGHAGQPIHPMVTSTNASVVHWIDFIYAKDQNGAVVAMRDLGASEAAPATLVFDIPVGTTQLVPYEHCNKHGLFRG